jgi:polyhydroxyalkanoate synthesis repressor PhaR
MLAVQAHGIAPMERLIKRYANRKMYDTRASRYVTLDGITDLVRSGDELRIVENDTGEDLTALIFAQIIFEEEKRKSGLLELPVLRWIIQRGGATVQEILDGVDRGREALENMREMAEKGVKQLFQTTAPEPRPAARQKRRAKAGPQRPGLIEEILEGPQRQLEQLQHRIDTQVRASLERLTAHPAIQKELRRIEASLKSVERQLSQLRRPPRRAASRRSPSRRRRPR